jgi:hypothetical protein
MFWMAIALAACGHASDAAIRAATSATIGAVAYTALKVATSGSAARGHCGGCESGEPPPPRPDAVLVSVECGADRGYTMFQPRGLTRWSCYFENSDGQRFACDGSSDVPPVELQRWCTEQRRAAIR